MAFWTNGEVEPKRNFRFKVEITSQDNDSATLWWAKSVNLPSFDVSETEHNFLDNKFYFPGRVSWNEITLTLVDPISLDATGRTAGILQKSGYMMKGEAGLKTISKKKAAGTSSSPLFGFSIIVLDADGAEVERWKLQNPFIKSAKFGDLAYDNDELKAIELSIRYDWAILESGDGSTTPGKKTYFGIDAEKPEDRTAE